MSRYRWVILALVMVLVFAAISAPFLISTFNQHLANETQLAVICTSARASVQELTALNEIADRLGIPHEFTVPEVPPECAP